MNLLDSNTTKLDKHTTKKIINDLSSMFNFDIDESVIRDIQLMQSKTIREDGINQDFTCRFAGLFTFRYNEKKVELLKVKEELSYITDRTELDKELKRLGCIREIDRKNTRLKFKFAKKGLYIPKLIVYTVWQDT